MYADDANITVTGNDMLEIEEKIPWVNSNGLMLDCKKNPLHDFQSPENRAKSDN